MLRESRHPQHRRSFPKPLAVALALAIAGCGSSSQAGRTTSGTVGSQSAPGDSRGARAILAVTPRAVSPGEPIGIGVRNVGSVTVHFGLGATVEKRVDGGWRDITKEAYGRQTPGGRAIQLVVKPGRSAGPHYQGVADVIKLSTKLAPGTYRVSKRVDYRAPPNQLNHSVIRAPFQLR